jgi:hypothetical protein
MYRRVIGPRGFLYSPRVETAPHHRTPHAFTYSNEKSGTDRTISYVHVISIVWLVMIGDFQSRGNFPFVPRHQRQRADWKPALRNGLLGCGKQQLISVGIDDLDHVVPPTRTSRSERSARRFHGEARRVQRRSVPRTSAPCLFAWHPRKG